jgi:benzoate membrane transport protein
MPVMVAWSTPGAALLASAGAGYSMAEATGAFLVCGALILLAGATGWFERVMDRIPAALASALLGGVLARFGIDAFGARAARAAGRADARGLPGRAARLAALRGPVVLAVATAFVAARGELRTETIALSLAAPVYTAPHFTLQAVIGLALPLFVVTMASQNLPGVAVIRASGYRSRSRARLTITGVATLLLAPFGAFALNLAAITAACAPAARRTPIRHGATRRRGVRHAVLRGGAVRRGVTGVLTAFPRELVVAIAGSRCSAPSAPRWHGAARRGAPRAGADHLPGDAVGLSIAGIGAPFWGWWPARSRVLVQQWRPSEDPFMKLLFVADPLERFKIAKDSTYAMMREAARRGHTLMACEPRELGWRSDGRAGGPVTAAVRDVELLEPGAPHWWRAAQLPGERRASR